MCAWTMHPNLRTEPFVPTLVTVPTGNATETVKAVGTVYEGVRVIDPRRINKAQPPHE